ncbi:MAG: restriction endonuclease subunit S [Planctomycetaceae bacterium]
MAGDWAIQRLENLTLSANTGLDAIRRAPIVTYPSAIKCLRIQDITKNKRLSEWGNTEVRDVDYEKFRLKENDLIMARTCSTGICLLVESDMPAVFNNGLARLRFHTSLVSPKFMYYVFQSRKFVSYIDGIAGGTSVQLNIKLGDLKKYKFPLPPLAEQKAIAHILGTLDDKIELNRRMNETLEEMARTLFKSWFVDFDPVRAKLDGRQPAGMDAETAALFPAEFQDSELGKIPKGWEVKKLEEICLTITSGGTPKTKETSYWGGGIPWLSSGETRNSFITHTQKTITESGAANSSTRHVAAGATVIAGAGQGKTRGQTSLLGIGTYINQSTVALIADENKCGPNFLYFDLERRYKEFRRISDSHSVRGSLTASILRRMKIVLPNPCITNIYESVVKAVVERCLENQKQSQRLASLRDTLLPKLLSGELRIKDAEKFVENAL